jgi:hypothetical protein
MLMSWWETQKAAELRRRHGGAMRIKRIIIPIIVTLGAAGSILAASAASGATAQASTVHVITNTTFAQG